jgi:hypothetical protein
MPKKIEKDIEELSVNIFVNEYGSLRAVYNRLYAIIHVYYSSRRQLVASGDTIALEKLLQMRKDMAMRLERVNTLIKDEQFPQDNFEVFAKEKLNKMHLAIGLIETASLIGELSTYSKTIMDYMRSCCEFAAKFITVLSDPGNQDLKALKSNLVTLLWQIDLLIKQSQPSEKGQATVPLTGPLSREKGQATVPLTGPLSREKGQATVPLARPLSREKGQATVPLSGVSQIEGVGRSPAEVHSNSDLSCGYVHEGYQSASRNSDPISSVDEALTILEKIDLFRSKSRDLEANVNSSRTSDAKSIVSELSEKVQEHPAESSGARKFQEMLDEKYGFRSDPDP